MSADPVRIQSLVTLFKDEIALLLEHLMSDLRTFLF